MTRRKEAGRVARVKPLGKCDLDRWPHAKYGLCEDWRPIAVEEVPSVRCDWWGHDGERGQCPSTRTSVIHGRPLCADHGPIVLRSLDEEKTSAASAERSDAPSISPLRAGGKEEA